MNAGIRVDDLTHLQHLLQPSQVTLHLLARLLAEELGDQRRDLAAGRLILELDDQLSAAVAGRITEADLAAVGHVGVGQCLPRNQLVGPILGGLRIPFHRGAGRRTRLPVRAPVADHLHRFEVGHEAGEILEVVPEGVDFGAGTIDGDGLHDVDTAGSATSRLRAEARPCPGSRSRRSADGW